MRRYIYIILYFILFIYLFIFFFFHKIMLLIMVSFFFPIYKAVLGEGLYNFPGTLCEVSYAVFATSISPHSTPLGIQKSLSLLLETGFHHLCLLPLYHSNFPNLKSQTQWFESL